MADEGRPATYDEVISAIAKKHGVSPALAKAVAETESGFDPNAVGQDVKGKNARGVFQLMPDTAKELGVEDPHDPIQNITGGIKYLKQLQTKYQDPEKVLQAYNGGGKHVDEGTVSEAAKAYSTSILSKMARNAVTNQPQVSGAGGPGAGAPPAEGEPPPRKGIVRRGAEALAASVNPMTPEGREGLGGIIGGTAAGIATGPFAPIGAPVGAMLGGQAAGLVNEAISGFQGGADEAARRIRNAGFEQGAYEAVGGLAARGASRVGRAVLGTGVGKAAKAAAESGLETAKGAYKAAMDVAKEKFGYAVETAEAAARESAAAYKTAAQANERRVAAEGAKEVKAARASKTAAVDTAEKSAAEREAMADLAASDASKAAEAQHAALVANPPSREELTGTTRKALAGLPGLYEGTGPVKAAKDLAGKQIAEVAAEGPALGTAEVKSAFDEMVGEARPKSLFGEPKAPTRATGFAPPGMTKSQQQYAAQAMAGMTPQAQAALKAQLGQFVEKLNLPPAHPLPGVLAQVQEGLSHGELPFAEAHRLKTLLDEAVNWDREAKGHLEQITKGVRVALRRELGQYEPYNAATRAYRDIIGLYKGKGAGPQFIRAAVDNPDRLATFLKSGSPDAAQQVRRLLVDQAAAGGALGKEGVVSVAGRDLDVTLSKQAAAGGEVIVPIKVSAFEPAFQREVGFHVGPGGAGGIEGRYQRFGEFVKNATSIEAPEVGIKADGSVGFTNGRHRYAWLRDQGAQTIPVSMTKEEAARASSLGYVDPQGSAGAKMGQRAWDAVRASHTYETLTKGNPEGLEQRVQNLIAQRPEFVKVVYGDQWGKERLDNLLTIGRTIREAGEAGAAGKAAAKEAGAAEVKAAQRAGKTGVQEALERSKANVRQARDLSAKSAEERRIAGQQDVAAATREAEAEQARAVAREAPKLEAAKKAVEPYTKGSMAAYTGGRKGALTDVASTTIIPIHPITGVRAGARLVYQFMLHSPKGADLIQATANSHVLTQEFARLFSGEASRYQGAQFIRKAIGAAGKTALRAPLANAAVAKRGRLAASEQEEPQAVNQ